MRLYSILSDSAVYTDYDNFVLVFSGDMNLAQELLSNMPLIRNVLDGYYTHVKELHLFYYDSVHHKIFRIIPNTNPVPPVFC